MLYADARSAREEKSKQRYGLQEFSRIRVSLVKGKNGWRVGSVEPIANYYTDAVDRAARGSVVNIFRFLRRFFKAEEPAQELYHYTHIALTVASEENPNRTMFEALVKLRILQMLGYVDAKKMPPAVLVEPKDMLQALTLLDQATVDALLSQAISSSHL